MAITFSRIIRRHSADAFNPNLSMKHISRRTATAITAIIIAMLPLAGCGGDSTTGPGTSTLVKPKVGTTYTYTDIKYDFGDSTLVLSSDTHTFRIIGTGTTAAGIKDIVSFFHVDDNDTNYAVYEPNGDLTLFTMSDTNADGMGDKVTNSETYPFSSHRSTQTWGDTSFFNGAIYRVRADSVLYLGNETLTVPAGTFTVSKVAILKDTRNYSVPGVLSSRIREGHTFYFAPSIGFLARWTKDYEAIDSTGKVIARKLLNRVELSSYKP
jgi:hypothetical protein